MDLILSTPGHFILSKPVNPKTAMTKNKKAAQLRAEILKLTRQYSREVHGKNRPAMI